MPDPMFSSASLQRRIRTTSDVVVPSRREANRIGRREATCVDEINGPIGIDGVHKFSTLASSSAPIVASARGVNAWVSSRLSCRWRGESV